MGGRRHATIMSFICCIHPTHRAAMLTFLFCYYLFYCMGVCTGEGEGGRHSGALVDFGGEDRVLPLLEVRKGMCVRAAVLHFRACVCGVCVGGLSNELSRCVRRRRRGL